ncbi:uncharacterized protein TrAFT101_001495 [Trichoderma asperellum]|uniref:Uncharacterized protein n=1 Tax=Trichoderma asperellum (strain ATCC 204424 / CBS 433.97 / NBRC 101777) TaxID=1042311 RepID=A0A2T3ZDM9_TRIA4|nr:hypothetical protein M441DRAFT_66691 [Trichoderma asperellum CBS 433.97]PTB42922.1 hypothetical protein M441DRAFT_66691 [Trichoderma asperellum CBS 433.97]UKZ85643.1 hypothetical protein TrAFT101_001495 [Trichoderma asperellum]
MADSLPGNNQTLVPDEGPISRPTSRASTIGWKQGSTNGDNTEAMDLDDTVVTTPNAQSKDGEIGSLEAIEPEGVQGNDTQEELIMKLFDMVQGVTAEELALKQLQITNAICRLKELQDQQPPRVSFSPAMANSSRERLEATLIYLTSELTAIPPANWTAYKKKLIKFSESEPVLNMNFPQRLYKVVDIIYLPEEMDAIPKEEFERMHSVARICAAAAQAMGPDGESVEALAEKWVSAKMQDLKFLKKMFRSMRGICKASTPERTEMSLETQA